jgi:hypothetical protein
MTPGAAAPELPAGHPDTWPGGTMHMSQGATAPLDATDCHWSDPGDSPCPFVHRVTVSEPLGVERLAAALKNAFASHAADAPSGSFTVKFDPIEGRPFVTRVVTEYNQLLELK